MEKQADFREKEGKIRIEGNFETKGSSSRGLSYEKFSDGN